MCIIYYARSSGHESGSHDLLPQSSASLSFTTVGRDVDVVKLA